MCGYKVCRIFNKGARVEPVMKSNEFYAQIQKKDSFTAFWLLCVKNNSSFDGEDYCHEMDVLSIAVFFSMYIWKVWRKVGRSEDWGREQRRGELTTPGGRPRLLCWARSRRVHHTYTRGWLVRKICSKAPGPGWALQMRATARRQRKWWASLQYPRPPLHSLQFSLVAIMVYLPKYKRANWK